MTDSSTEVFRMLAATGQVGGWVVRDSEVSIQGRPLQHALDEQGLPLLIVPIAQSDHHADLFAGLAISAAPSGDPPRIFVRCLDAQLASQFSYFVDDLIAAIEAANVPTWKTCEDVIENWRELFRATSSPILGLEAQVGLLAELRLLEQVVRQSRGGWETWVGSDKARHDFRGLLNAVEVKSTLRHHQFAVTVHGFGQLDPPPGSDLYVYAERMERATGPSAESLFSVASRLIEIAPRRSDFLSQLRMAGLEPAQLEIYSNFEFVVLEQRLLLVGSDFPRISKDAIGEDRAALIPELQYVINIGALAPVEIAAAALSAAANLLLEK